MSSPTCRRRAIGIRAGMVGIVLLPLTLLLHWIAGPRPYRLALGPEPVVHSASGALWECLFIVSPFAFIAGLLCVLFAVLPLGASRFVRGAAVAGGTLALVVYLADRFAHLSSDAFLILYPTSLVFIAMPSDAPAWYILILFSFTVLTNALIYAMLAFALWAISRPFFTARSGVTK